MIFIDASALVAIIANEADHLDLFARIEADTKRLFSPVSRWETVVSLCRSHGFALPEAIDLVDDFIQTFSMEVAPIGPQEAELALKAYAKYGRGRHPAALNMGDCFAYACAKSHDAALLYKGNDFAQTDLA